MKPAILGAIALICSGGIGCQVSRKATTAPTPVAQSASKPASQPAVQKAFEELVRVYSRQEVFCLNPGEEHRVNLKDGSSRTVRLVSVKEYRDSVINQMRRAEVAVQIDGKAVDLTCAPYVMPTVIGRLRIQADTTSSWTTDHKGQQLPAQVQFSAWDASDPIVDTSKFGFSIRNYRMFSHGMQGFNEPVHLGKGDGDPKGQKFCHSYGMDMGGAEGAEEVLSATDSEIIGFWPSREKLCSVLVQDAGGFTWEYAHLASVEPGIVIGAKLARGQKIGMLGKTGPSGNFSHLHLGSFVSRADMENDRPGKRLNLYPWLVTAYQAEHPKALIAVARPHQTVLAGEKLVLDGSNSLAFGGKITSWKWILPDNGRAFEQTKVETTFDKPGTYIATLWVKDDRGIEDVDFCQIRVFSKDNPEPNMPTIYMTCTPTEDVTVGQDLTFRFWFQGAEPPAMKVDFGDGKTIDEYKSYEKATHRYVTPGIYVVTTSCRWHDLPIMCKMKVVVDKGPRTHPAK